MEKKLTACIHIKQVESLYRWNNKINNDEEYELSIKTKKILFNKIREIILQIHDYEIPQIIVIDIVEGYRKYLEWIDKETE